MEWADELVCGVPSPVGTDWEGGVFPVTMIFYTEYPMRAPKVMLPSGFWHPNVYPSGRVCQSIVSDDLDWESSITAKDILRMCSSQLNNPNPNSPAQAAAYHLFINNRPGYSVKIREQAAHYSEARFLEGPGLNCVDSSEDDSLVDGEIGDNIVNVDRILHSD